MKCHYEVLDVSRDSNDADIKSAYRKMALKWHPDKNLDNVEFAKEQFQIVQQAYEILSDRQERAWYDNHREQILRGSSTKFEDKSLNVFQYFTTTCFKGYGDDANGFYSVYRNVFDKVAKEDMEFMEEKEEFCEIPSFGNSMTDYEKVSEFYGYWLNYTTRKSYVWLDPYDIKDIRERRYLKLVDKENKKVRQKAKKERNEEIRNLVSFVRKRDKRVEAQMKLQKQKLVEDKKKREKLSQQKRLERRQELNDQKNQPEWAKFDNVKSELEEIEKSLAEEFSEEEEEDLDNLYCIACNKIFKTPKAFENHESSKKHKENIEILKKVMLEENSSNPSDDIEKDHEEAENISEEENLSEEENISEDENISDDENNSEEENISEKDPQIEMLSESDSIDEIKSKKKKKKRRTVINVSDEEINHASILETNNSDDDFSTSKKHKNKKKKGDIKTKAEVTVECSEEPTEMKSVQTPEPGTSASGANMNLKKEKRKGKKNRKGVITDSDIQEVDIDHNCITCKYSFSSKNKLFAHLKKTGHGVYIPTNVKSKKKKCVQE